MVTPPYPDSNIQRSLKSGDLVTVSGCRMLRGECGKTLRRVAGCTFCVERRIVSQVGVAVGEGVKLESAEVHPKLHRSNHTVSFSFLVLNVDGNLIWFIRDVLTHISQIHSTCTPRAHTS